MRCPGSRTRHPALPDAKGALAGLGLIAALVAQPSSAQANRAEVLLFQEAAPAGQPELSDAAPIATGEALLADAFGEFGDTPLPSPPRFDPSVPIAAADACAAHPYRPRGDLPLAVEIRRSRLFPLVAAAACRAGVPVGLFDALVTQESRYDPWAVSPKGARGLAQLMPGTARSLAVFDAHDATANLRGGATYLRRQLDAFGRVDLALAAYNAGPGRVRRRAAVPAIAETRGYVAKVTMGWLRASGSPPVLTSAWRAPLPHPYFATARQASLLVFAAPNAGGG